MKNTSTSIGLALIILILIISCKEQREEKAKPPAKKKIELIASYKLQMPEPSGLSLSFDKKNLWTVSDEDSTVYLISFKGVTRKKFKVDGYDLEGITVLDEKRLAVILERSRELMFVTHQGIELFRKGIDVKGEENSGPEGLTVNPDSGEIFIINEKNPKTLLIYDWYGDLKSKKDLNFADDFSGLFYEKTENTIWVVSDESKLIAKCDLEGNVIEQFKIDIPQVEGIAVDFGHGKIYVVSDKTGYLYVYSYN